MLHKARKTILLYLLGFAGLVLLGTFFYEAISNAALTTKRAQLLTSPRPMPGWLDSVDPVPGSQIASSAILAGPRRVDVCFQSPSTVAGLDLANDTSIDTINRVSLMLNGTKAESWGESIRKVDSGVIWAKITICWEIRPAPGDYLAQLTIRGVDSTLEYEWAFRITND